MLAWTKRLELRPLVSWPLPPHLLLTTNDSNRISWLCSSAMWLQCEALVKKLHLQAWRFQATCPNAKRFCSERQNPLESRAYHKARLGATRKTHSHCSWAIPDLSVPLLFLAKQNNWCRPFKVQIHKQSSASVCYRDFFNSKGWNGLDFFCVFCPFAEYSSTQIFLFR